MPNGKGIFGGPPLVMRTAIVILAAVALVGLGFIANGLYDKAKAELSDPAQPAAKHSVRTTVDLDPVEAPTRNPSTLSI